MGSGSLLPAHPFWRENGWGLRTAHLPLVSLEDEYEGQGQAHGRQGHEEHTHPVVPQGKHLAGGVDVGPHHHIENLQETEKEHDQECRCSTEALHSKGDTLRTRLTPSSETKSSQGQERTDRGL